MVYEPLKSVDSLWIDVAGLTATGVGQFPLRNKKGNLSKKFKLSGFIIQEILIRFGSDDSRIGHTVRTHREYILEFKKANGRRYYQEAYGQGLRIH